MRRRSGRPSRRRCRPAPPVLAGRFLVDDGDDIQAERIGDGIGKFGRDSREWWRMPPADPSPDRSRPVPRRRRRRPHRRPARRRAHLSVPTTASLAKMPVSMPTVAGQLSSADAHRRQHRCDRLRRRGQHRVARCSRCRTSRRFRPSRARAGRRTTHDDHPSGAEDERFRRSQVRSSMLFSVGRW